MSKLALIRRAIARVPRGKVITYGQAAEVAGFPHGARLAVRALYGGTWLPWHRVVAAGGRIALKGEDGQEQRLRLKIEGVTFRGSRVRMDLHAWIRQPGRKRPKS
jgi:methylated-DNA-protein-cysteine methyltransferase related protein